MCLLNAGLFFDGSTAADWLLEFLQFDRTAILDGQIWRVLTGNLVHWSTEHFLLDVGAFLFVGWLFERSMGKVYPWILLAGGLLVGVAVLMFLPEMATYRGLSGIDSGQFAAALCIEARLARRKRQGQLFVLPAAMIFVTKIASECATGTMFFGTESLGDLGQPVPLAHLAGALGSLLAMGMALLYEGAPARKLYSAIPSSDVSCVA